MHRGVLLAVLICFPLSVGTGGSLPEPREEPSGSVELSFSTYLGGSGTDDCDGLAVDGSGNIYLACHSNSRDFPVPDGANYENRGGFDAFVVKLNPATSEVDYVAHFGGEKWDGAIGVTIDAHGNIYVVGATQSADFPATSGAVQVALNGETDVFILKLDPGGSVVYSTYLGGSGEDSGNSIAVDKEGNVYVSGVTNSPDFPTANAFQSALGGGRDIFVTKLNATGTALVYSSYLGGSGNDTRWGGRLAVDPAGHVYVAGNTESADFPTSNPLQATLAGARDLFVAKFNPAGSALLFSTYLGGSGEENEGSIALDHSGNVYVAGETNSTDFPTTASAFQTTLRGDMDVFVAKLNSSGSEIIYSTYLGGTGEEYIASAVAVDRSGHAYVSGQTRSTDYPVVEPLQAGFGGGESDAFMTKLSPTGSALEYSTYLGGGKAEIFESLALDRRGNAYATGWTHSPNFPTANPVQAAHGGGEFDVMVAKLSEASVAVARRVAEVGHSASVSADGRMLAYADHIEGLSYEDVFVLDLLTGQRRRLTRAGSGEEYGSDLAISPEGQQVAYEWITGDGSRDLRLIGTDGSGLRTLYRNPEVHRVFPKRWSPDGKHILVILWREDQTNRIALLSAADGSVRVVKTLQGGDPWTRAMSLSPDGRYIAYDFRPREGSSQRDIYVVSVFGGREVALVESPADDRLLDWTPDGRGVLFTSDRAGTVDVWMVGIDEGKPQGQPTLVRAGFEAEVRGLGFDRKGSYYYVFAAWENDVYLAALDSATGRLHPPSKLVSQVGFDTSVEWSPDGGSLAYAWGLGYGRGPFVLGIRTLGEGRERRFRLGRITRFGGHAFQPRWSPDGGYILAQARDTEGRQGFYQIDTRTGGVAPLVQTETRCTPDCLEWPVWVRDGKVIFTRWTEPWPGRTIVARDVESGQEKMLYSAVAPVGVAHLAVSPDAQRLAFIWWDSETGAASVKVMPVAGGEPRELVQLSRPELTSYGQPLVELAWTPDSGHIIYATSSASKPKLDFWRISADGGEPEHLGLEMEGLLPYGLSVHPDGRRIAFTAGTPRREEVWALENILPADKPPN